RHVELNRAALVRADRLPGEERHPVLRLLPSPGRLHLYTAADRLQAADADFGGLRADGHELHVGATGEETGQGRDDEERSRHLSSRAARPRRPWAAWRRPAW